MVWLWVVLVVATLVGGYFLVRHLIRSGKALLAEVHRATEALERLQERAEQLAAAAEAAHPVEPVTIEDPARAHRLWDAARARHEDRRARRDARREATFRRWLSFSR
ncbi:hypothetical protein Q6348_11145 [Isoptericola sp. b441]|uniref:Uncharacterized protein n=1 Tax=Actinotalea lenta TaxID=3064654 RepID=A0ABT9DA23_9CELL|nr:MULTISPECIES: hypothetical protein [unclassified Isoptericola]MDO8107752.1 hypothetical protein [Isoptericola sp. b441]MDO8120577.1 hypothetical protein [Isoptericola sp. b490]